MLLQASYTQASIDVCSSGVGIPPFLASGVAPNVLLMIDNSASMYDPAYDDTTAPGLCNDDSFTAATTYAGYFEPATRYYYNLHPVAGDFAKFKSPAATTYCNDNAAGGTVYSNTDVCIAIAAGSPKTVTAFAATGNFLNWAMASKFDIEKSILTGGKYDSTNHRMVMESRGCMGKRMIKQVAVTNGGTTYQLDLGVWPGANATDHLTRIEIFETSTNGLLFNNSACEQAIAATAFGQTQNLAGDCLMIGQQQESFANSNAAFNHGFQTCWGYPTVGTGDIQRMQNACANVYDAGTNPTSIKVTDSGYVCMGDSATGSGYIGRCAQVTSPGSPAVAQTCTNDTCAPAVGITHPYNGNNNQECDNGMLKECLSGSTWQAAFSGPQCPSGTTYQAQQSITDCSNLSGYTYDATNNTCYKCDSGYTYNPATQTCSMTSCPTGYTQDGGTCYSCPAGYTYNAGSHTCSTTTCTSGTYYAPTQTCNTCPSGYTYDVGNNTCNQCTGSGYSYSQAAHTCTKHDKPNQAPVQTGITHGTPDPTTIARTEIPLSKPPTTGQPTTTVTSQSGCYNDHNGHYDSQPTMVDKPAGCYDSGGSLTYWVQKQTCVGGTPAVPPVWNWVANADQAGGCIELAIRDYCLGLYDPNVIDTSSPVSTVASDHYPNLPAVLVSVASNAQLGTPLATLDGYIARATAPQGLLQEFSDLRMGAMRFNTEGTKSECSNAATNNHLFNCTATNQDGGRLVTYIDANNNTGLVNAINNIEANSWTPLSEAMYEAIGYYSQDASLRLDPYDFFTGGSANFVTNKTYAAGSVVWDGSNWWRTALGGTSKGPSPGTDQAAGGITDWQQMVYPDWANNSSYSGNDIVSSAGQLYRTAAGGTSSGGTLLTDTGVTWTPYYDPIIAHCQSNNILVITDGTSTADQASAMTTFATSATVGATPEGDPDNDGLPGCGDYSGSTYLDNLTGYAHSASLFSGSKNPINTYVVAAGSLKNEGIGQCNPTTLLHDTAVSGGTTDYYHSENPAQLSANLRTVFSTIRSGAASGSAASVISASRGGEGAVYQAIFWPSMDDGSGTGSTTDWVGEVHALFLDADGTMYEDTNHNRTLDSNDRRVTLFYDDTLSRTRACVGGTVTNGVCSVPAVELNTVNYLWSANDWLAKMSDADTRTNRPAYISDTRKRYLFTWEDRNNNGIPDSDEILSFEAQDWTGISVAASRGAVVKDFDADSSNEVNNIVNWVRGDNTITDYRTRNVRRDLNLDGTPDNTVWRLGDIINSTPVTVSRPTEAYHFLYRDTTYAAFVDRYKNRRHMIYFGGNDGILHAANGGFYDTDSKKFCLAATGCTDADEVGQPELGAELWGYVPYNLLPHLKCQTAPDYKAQHKYFVDLRPRIFDVKIFPEEGDCATSKTAAGCIHPNGWGTILVGGMRFGGAPMSAHDDLESGVAADNRIFASSYFILDITNPEAPPTLLGELTRTSDAAPNDQVNLGYTTAIPTMVPMNDLTATPASYAWYLILGSGPTTLEGRSSQPPKVAVLPLTWLVGATKQALRIPNHTPQTATGGGSYSLGTATGLSSNYNGFTSDMITADYNLQNFMADAVYFGTVDCRGNCDGSRPTWGGTMYHLVTRNIVAGTQALTSPDTWYIQPLIDVAQPITTAPSVATDGDNFWVYFGTGRFIDAVLDKTDSSTQSFYGIKEPQDCAREFTWDPVTLGDPSELIGNVGSLTHDGTPGSQGVLEVDQILAESGASAASPITCIPGANDTTWGQYYNAASNAICQALLAKGVGTFAELRDYITGTSGTCTGSETIQTKKTGTDGWYRNFTSPRERNLGQAAVLGGLVDFTTYQPFSDICLSEGLGYLYSLYYQTGTAYYKPTLGLSAVSNTTPASILHRITLGKGLATTPNLHVGIQGAKAFVQTSTGEIKEVESTNQPEAIKSGRSSWKEVQ